ncbi:ribonuclease VapC [Betaproteobacteria bacterium]|nr:ribonuclease VapC [Betaproteobacteria bacterium]
MNFVLDNSVCMCWLLPPEKATDATYALNVLETLTEAEAYAPSLWALEVANVIARAEGKKIITEARAQTFISFLERLKITTDAETTVHALGDTLNLARRYKLSAYDASYLELALRLGLPLATLDADLSKAAQKIGVPGYRAA